MEYKVTFEFKGMCMQGVYNYMYKRMAHWGGGGGGALGGDGG